MVVDEADFRLTKGELKSFESKSAVGRAKLGAFCPECGSRIYHKLDLRKGFLSVKPGTLDDTATLKPDTHLWTSNKQAWIDIPEGVQVFEEQPG